MTDRTRDAKTPLTAISGRESVFDKRLREFRNTGSFQKPQPKSLLFAKKQAADFETPSMDSKLRPKSSDNEEITEIEKLAFYDEASGLLNTRTTLGKLAQEIRRSGRYKHSFALFIVELDGYANEDGLTPLAKEMLFADFCKVMRKNVREVDIIGRFDEPSVLVICPETNLGDAIIEAERLKSTIASTHFKRVSSHAAMTVSIGISCYPEHGTTPVEILGCALEAAQQAVSYGGNAIAAAKAEAQVTEEIKPLVDFSPELDATPPQVDMSPTTTVSNDMAFVAPEVSSTMVK